MRFWRVVFLAAFLLGVALGILIALVALHAAIFFGTLAPGAEADKTHTVQHTIHHLVREELQTFSTGVTVLDVILEKAHALCPNRVGEN